MNTKLRNMCFTALMAAIICILAPYSINIGPVPLSLASFAVYVAGAVLGVKKGSAAVGIYIVLGAVGLPVFSNFGAGLAKLTGPTGGYIIGYLPCAALTGLGVEYFGEKKCKIFGGGFHWSYPVFMLLGTLALYMLGTAWFMFETKYALRAALPLCVIPFLPGDLIKIIIATALGFALRGRLRSAGIIA